MKKRSQRNKCSQKNKFDQKLEKFNQKLDKFKSTAIGLIVLFTLLGFGVNACGLLVAGGKKDKTVAQVEKQLKESGLPPESLLLNRDGIKYNPAALKPYTAMLDKAEAKCLEGRVELTLYITALTKAAQIEDPQAKSIDVGDYFVSAIERSIKRKKQASCEQIYIDLHQSLKEE